MACCPPWKESECTKEYNNFKNYYQPWTSPSLWPNCWNLVGLSDLPRKHKHDRDLEEKDDKDWKKENDRDWEKEDDKDQKKEDD